MSAIAYRRFRAPEKHGESLVEPVAQDAPKLIAANRARLSAHDFLCGGRSFAELRRELRREVLVAAADYVREYAPERAPLELNSDAPLLVTGHQPQLFHPGAWFKNFLLSSLAARTGGVALNLLIDNDLAREASVRVPSGTSGRPRLEMVAYDEPLADAPWEDRPLVKRELFASFAERVCTAVSGVVPDPLVSELWPACVASAARQGNLGRALAEGRHVLELRWGLSNWELPLSRVCETESFHRFTVHMLEQLPRFAAAYNTCLGEYRAVHGIRNGAHPAPNLVEREGRLEAPLWIWSRDQAHRRPVFLECSPTEVVITGDTPLVLPVGSAERCDRAVQLLAEASARGERVRPRALITTLFARLFLADLFVHGIGGAKYDQVTDLLLEIFFDIEPPAFITTTATVRLPGVLANEGEAEWRRVEHDLRALVYHPEAFLNADAQRATSAQKALEQKRFWLSQALPRGQRSARQRGIAEANQALALFATEAQSQLAADRARLEQQLPSQRILNSREYSFCLFPESFLRGLLLDISCASR